MKLCLLLTFLSLISVGFTKEENIYPVNLSYGDKYIDISFPDSNHISFKSCLYKIDNSCESIGKDRYSIVELKKQKIIEFIQIPSAFVADVAALVVIGAGVVYSSPIISGALFTGGNIATGLGAVLVVFPVTATIGYAGWRWITKNINSLNPGVQKRQYNALDTKTLSDIDYTVKDIEETIYSLSTVLSKL
jgi:hypothetical protein